MDFDAYAIEKAAVAAGPDAMQALEADYDRKTLQFFGAWVIANRADVQAIEEYATAAAVGWAEAFRRLPGFQLCRADFDELPIFDFDIKTPELPAGMSRLRFGDTWLVWKRAFCLPTAMLYRVDISIGPYWE